jgi:hypothetical protein
METKMLKALKIEPGKAPERIELADTLKAMQNIVGGNIELAMLDEIVCLVCNEEGKLLGLEYNRSVGDDIIAGTFFLVGDDGEGDFCSLTEEQFRQYESVFAQPEVFHTADREQTFPSSSM